MKKMLLTYVIAILLMPVVAEAEFAVDIFDGGLIGADSDTTGKVMGIGFGYNRYRIEYSTSRYENEGNDERTEIDITSTYLGYRYPMIDIKKPSDRLYFSRLYLDLGVEAANWSGDKAKVINPDKYWGHPHLGPSDLSIREVDEVRIQGATGIGLELRIENFMTLSVTTRGHFGTDNYLTVVGSIGFRY